MDTLMAHGATVVLNPHGRKMNAEETVALLQDADGLLAGLEPLDASVLGQAPRLRAVARIGIGMDNVDRDFAESRGIKVSNTPDGPTQAVAELALAALMCMLRQVVAADNALHAGEWRKQIGRGLIGLKVLLIGYGRIGRRFGGMLHALGADVMATDPALDADQCAPVRAVGLTEGLAEADVISLHASGRDVIIDRKAVGRMRDGVMLMNCARAGLVDTDAVVDALRSGRIGGAWFDVFDEEPYHGVLQEFPQVLMTPHVSSYTRECRAEMEMQAVLNLLQDLGLRNG